MQPNPKRDGPGVPEALTRALDLIRERLGTDRVDTLWLFPPLVRGRTERGLVVASCFEPVEAGSDLDRRLLHTLTYQAEQTGRGGTTVEAELFAEGVAPEDLLPSVIRGVVKRTEIELGEPRNVKIGGDAAEFEQLLEELAPPAPDLVMS